MRLEHLAIWAKDLEGVKNFFTKYFNMESNEKYVNTTKGFSSYFLSFKKEKTQSTFTSVSGYSSSVVTLQSNPVRIEVMHRHDISDNENGNRGMVYGLAHIAIGVGNKQKVDALTERLRADGYTIIGEPRMTGDGFYESIVEDSEGNYIELMGTPQQS